MIRNPFLFYGFYNLELKFPKMTIKLDCKDYGFECDFSLEGSKNPKLIEEIRKHFESEHGIDYSIETVIQMMINRGHSRESILGN